MIKENLLVLPPGDTRAKLVVVTQPEGGILPGPLDNLLLPPRFNRHVV